ncbi:hypothetical protein [Ferrimonas marina]|uniref:Uncharacterized protein n=1 Tax=Ferrimonas marina TaxID=299255 RepID=A0A1M5NIX4_9GAMM|nr:hypothetical protein [Ferrimonas marina]SHG89534.1 hypothetical protein SAMN02745129_1075 [Ferrimonas marina]
MSKLNKEEVIAQFTAAYLAKNGKEPQIEQKGSWFKVDGGKSVRLGELAEMINELGGAEASAPAKQPEAAKPADKPVAKKAAAKQKPAKKKAVATSGNGGLTAKQLWAQKVGQGNRLPRGC